MDESYNHRGKSTPPQFFATLFLQQHLRESCRLQKDTRTDEVFGKSTLTIQIQANRVWQKAVFIYFVLRLPNAISYDGISLLQHIIRTSNCPKLALIWDILRLWSNSLTSNYSKSVAYVVYNSYPHDSKMHQQLLK